MTRRFDPWFGPHIQGRTPDDISHCLRESTADLMAGEHDTAPTSWAELDVDGETHLRPRLSRAAQRSRMRPVQQGPYDEHGYDRNGVYDPGHDGRW